MVWPEYRDSGIGRQELRLFEVGRYGYVNTAPLSNHRPILAPFEVCSSFDIGTLLDPALHKIGEIIYLPPVGTGPSINSRPVDHFNSAHLDSGSFVRYLIFYHIKLFNLDLGQF